MSSRPSTSSLRARRAGPAAARLAEPAATAASPTERIVAGITEAIVERRLMPGTKLVEQKIADIYSVSRTIVRQALNQLSRDRLVVLAPARGAFVATPGVDEARQVFAVRQLLELALVRQLCASITPAQLAQLRAHLADEQAALARVDVPGRTRLLADFHTLLARLAGNAVLEHILADLLTRCSLIALMYQSAHAAGHSQAGHVAIVEAIARRDADAAARLMAEHLASVEQALQLPGRAPDLAAVLKPAAATPAATRGATAATAAAAR